MRRFLTLVCLLCLAIPAGISISGCTRNPDENYCNGLGYGLKVTDVASLTLTPQTGGISLAFGQTQQVATPYPKNCKGTAASVANNTYSWGTSNNQLADISPTGIICAGTWNRNTGGGIPNYTVCNKPNPLPSTNGLPYTVGYVTASVQSVTSNPVQVYIHSQVTSVGLVTQPLSGSGQQCFSQGAVASLDAQACFAGANNTQYVLCAPPSVTSSSNPIYACPGGLPPGVTSSQIPDCTSSIGTLNYSVGTTSIASIATNTTTNQVSITAEQPGTTVITASVAGSGSSAGYFSTCPPQSINLALADGSTEGTVTQGVTQNLTTTVLDTNNNPITGLTLTYQSTDPIDITAGTGGAITTNYPGTASIYAICQPSVCNPAPTNQIGLYGTGLSISSNPVKITTPGTASDYLWFAAPGLSQYFVPVELINGTVGSTVRLPFVPNSMVMDRLGTDLYFGSSHELMEYISATDTVAKVDTSAPGVVLAVSPNNTTLLINDQERQLFYIYSVKNGISATFGGMGNAAVWTPDSQTLYITDNAALNDPPDPTGQNPPKITGHTNTLYVYNATNGGWTTYPLPPSPLPTGTQPPVPPGSQPWSSLLPNVAVSSTMQTPAITIPSVGAFLRGNPTVAHTWCPSGNVGAYNSMVFYPQGPDPDNSVPVQSDVLAATTDGSHIFGASTSSGGITLSDIGVTVPAFNCLPSGVSDTSLATGNPLAPLVLENTWSQTQIAANASAVNQVVTAPETNMAFITYNPSGTSTNASLPYYLPGTGGAGGTVGYVTLGGSSASAITAPLAGAFSPDNSYFFVSTAGDNLIHYISIPASVTPSTPPTDVQQIAPNLPACTPVSAGGDDIGCTNSGSGSGIVPATVIAVKPRTTT